jgi:preprotein translocase subunit YajC
VNYWPYVVVLVLLGLMLALSMRNRRRAAVVDAERASRIGFGTEVMTTSGLYGTVVRRNDDGTVQLAIAPGIEVKWALAALREASELPQQYRQGLAETDPEQPADQPQREPGS